MIAFFAVVFLFSIYKISEYIISGHESRETYDELRAIYASGGGVARLSGSSEPVPEQASRVTGPDQGAQPMNVSRGDAQEPNQWKAVDGAAVASRQAERAVAGLLASESTVNMLKTYEIQEKFVPLLEENEDIIGWISIDHTSIEYPVVQGADNKEYLRLNTKKRWSLAGSIFMDYRNDIKEEDQNMIIYGHNMRDGTMFSELVVYEDQEFEEDLSTIRFDTIYEDLSWEVFAAYRTTTDHHYLITSFATEDAFMQYVEDAFARSVYESDVVVSAGDRILTLSTCSDGSDVERFVVHARLVRE